jgi:hypothetical protein
MKTDLEVTAWALIGLLVLGVLLFWPAATFDYWQAWTFIAAFSLATVVPNTYLGRTDPAALQRRMHAGPAAEGRVRQKIIILAAFLGLFIMLAFSAFDHRFGWSSVPAAVWRVGLRCGLGSTGGSSESTSVVGSGWCAVAFVIPTASRE